MKKFWILMIFLLAGCATNQAQHGEEEFAAASKRYLDDLTGDATLAQLWTRTGPRIRDITFVQLTIEDKATESEKVAILRWAERYEKNAQESEEIKRRYGVDVRTIALGQQYRDASQNARAQLYAGELTWGAFNRKLKEISSAFDKANAEVLAAVRARNAQAAADAAAYAQQTYANILSFRATMPRTTICNRIGNSVYCNTN